MYQHHFRFYAYTERRAHAHEHMRAPLRWDYTSRCVSIRHAHIMHTEQCGGNPRYFQVLIVRASACCLVVLARWCGTMVFLPLAYAECTQESELLMTVVATKTEC